MTDRLDAAVRAALARTGTPGAVLALARDGREEVRAWGAAQTHDRECPLQQPVLMRTTTLLDVASLTKVVATTAVAMVLLQQGRLALDDPVARFVPAFTGGGRERVSVSHLLAHRSGLDDWAPLFLLADQPGAAIDAICAQPLSAAPGAAHVYSDLGMMLLGVVLEHCGDASLEDLTRDLVTGPLGMDDTAFRPDATQRTGIAATSTGNPVERRMVAQRHPELAGGDGGWWRDRVLVGEVNDANAAIAFQGVAGHAGLFSTAGDLLRFGAELLAAARGEAGRVFEVETVRRFTTPGPEPGQGLGFWTRRLHVPAAADATFGHRGFTGCELLIDPVREMVVVLLSNRLHGGDPPPSHDDLWQPVLADVLRDAPV